MFNSYNYGGYLVRYLPEHKVFIDGRGDLYELGGAFSDYLQISMIRPAAFSLMKSYGIHFCLLGRGEPLAVVLAERPEWKRVYSDDLSVIYERQDSASPEASGQPSQLTATRSGHDSPTD
jgi:hypothetical protein